MHNLSSCKLCPRECGTDRNNGTGFCGVGSRIRVARAALHFWEEPCVSGKQGSGTVFFSGCSLRCVYCQNQEISRGKKGTEISPERLTGIFFELKEQGALNINLVTADHFLPVIRPAIESARKQGIGLPFLLNTSAYLKTDVVKSLEGLIDIYLPDYKYIRSVDSLRYSHAADYPEVAKKAIAEMVRQQPRCVFTKEDPGILLRGVVVRHLLLPGMLIQAKRIVSELYHTYGDQIWISLLSQYTPDHGLLSEEYPEIDRMITGREYKSLTDFAAGLGVTQGFVQNRSSADRCFIPDFDGTGVRFDEQK